MSEAIQSGDPRIERFIGDDYYTLCLNIGELRILQRSLNAGPPLVLDRLMTGVWEVDDILETLRLALVGGGVDHQKAKQLVSDYVTAGYLAKYLIPAAEVLSAALRGNDEDTPDLGEPQAPVTPTHED